jgi:bifunctional enzyme CysN/CysC
MDLLRFTTAGSVDDGKSTLIGRLLYETGSIFDDQLQSVASASRQLGEDRLNFALLTDGLRAEREQKITIDVAYRSFSTSRRRFILADTPGHAQYTRNMVTGASTADLAVILVDASKGVLTQSRRHAFILALLGIPQLIVAINKMDLVGFSEAVYHESRTAFAAFARDLTFANVAYLPLCAVDGDNVVERSRRMPWYRGESLLHLLEGAPVDARTNAMDFRFAVQLVIRPNHEFRGYAGTIASGSVKTGDEVMALPSKLTTQVTSISTASGATGMASSGEAVVLTTSGDIDISRGDMLVRADTMPDVARALDVHLCWMDSVPLIIGKPYILGHTTRRVQAVVTRLEHRVDVDTLRADDAATLDFNEIGRAHLVTSAPVFVDSYRLNAATGSFILIDPSTSLTVAAGMIRAATQGPLSPAAAGAVGHGSHVSRERRERHQQHRAAIVWFTGLSGAGKSTTARLVEERLFADGHHTMLLDGDQLRQGLCDDLAFLPADRTENIRRAGEVARLFFEHGAIVLCAFVSPYRTDRERVRKLIGDGPFVEVFVDADLETCRARDPKGLYRRAAAGQLEQFTGVSAPYEAPANPELIIDTTRRSPDEAAEQVLEYLRAAGLTRPSTRDA